MEQLISLKLSSKGILFHYIFYYKHFNVKNQSKKHANNKMQLCIGKDLLDID